MSKDKVVTLHGSTFLIANAIGDIEKSSSPEWVSGFFYKDMRHLSEWRLLVDNSTPKGLSCDDLEYYFTQHFLAPATGTIYKNPDFSLCRRRMLSDGIVEVLEVMNHSNQEKTVRIEYQFESDFADLFEVKDALTKKGKVYQESHGEGWVIGYQRESYSRTTLIQCTFPCRFSPGRIFAEIVIPPKSQRTLETRILAGDGRETASLKHTADSTSPKPNIRTGFKDWILSAPAVECSQNAVERVYRRSLIDLAALRFYPDSENMPEASVPAAGLPWFMALFGRDSVITSYQALPFTSELAATTLRLLAKFQGTKIDGFRDEEPGKILHELRFGELTVFGEWPHSPYYGAADSTPLFLILLDEYERWTHDEGLVRDLEGNARRALEWIDKYGDRDGDGFVEYQRAMPTGLENQCWKDSWNSMLFSDGRVAHAPIAACEIQGYVYDAKVRCARLAREIWRDEDLARSLEHAAAELKTRFNERYWLEDRKYYALALDEDKRLVDSLSSNIGHLLWSGIVPTGRAGFVADHLLGHELFSGWGVRTMGNGDSGYNPIEYHNGTVWPHDNSLIAAGLARYGFRGQAAEICSALFQAAVFFNFRLPEVFAGYPREKTEFPVEYPTASSPQAWATGAPLLALRVLLGLEATAKGLESKPFLTKEIAALKVKRIAGHWGRTDVEAVNQGALSREQFMEKLLSQREQATSLP